jgi:Fe-S cluster assembly protein SufB
VLTSPRLSFTRDGRRLIALDDAQIKYSTVQNCYAGVEEGVGGIYNFVTKRG